MCRLTEKSQMKNKEIAVIGIACRFPGAKNYHEFWNNLAQGVNSIQEIPSERWEIDKYYSPIFDEPNKSISKWCGLLDKIDQFDNRFFSISKREAKNMDPQQRLLLEETWHCIEDSGISLKTLQDKKTSVYVGVMANDYHQEAIAPGVVTDSYAALGNYNCILANRISYTFGFQGTSLSIDAACAASLVALHNAKTSLLLGESDYAIVASVSLNFQPWKYISFSKSRMLSPDGQCKTFDKNANGYVPGDGLGVLLLQPLEKANHAHNHIYSIIKGSAVNHGGQTLSITAPRVEAQRDVILAAYKDAGINPETVTYVEAHGTGTSLGDPIEVEALTRSFREYTTALHYCAIGSVKTNIGHLEAAAGIAGVIKVLLMMQHQKIPPTLNLKTINPVINFAESPFVVATELQNWQSRKTDLPLRAGISSFGFGGVNSHIIIEFCSQNNKSSSNFNFSVTKPKNSGYLFILSAKSPTALKNMFDQWKDFVDNEEYSKYHLNDICATLMTGRRQFPYRYGISVNHKDQLKAFLSKDVPSNVKSTIHDWCLRVGEFVWEKFADLQPLLEQEPLFKKHLDMVEQCLSTLPIPKKIKQRFQKRKSWTASTLPLYSFMVNYAYLITLIELGFTPSMITGEKAGLWLSLTLSGMITLEDALAVLSHQKTVETIELARPSIPFYDPVNQKTYLSYHFDEDYLHLIKNDLNVATADLHYFLERAKLLKDNQFTFNKYLEEWSQILRQHTGKELNSMLYNDNFIHSEEERYRKEKVLLMIIIKSTLHQLDQKWDLTRKQRITEPKFQELLDLVLDNVIPKETLIELFMNDNISDLAGMATLLNQRQHHLNANKPYQFITTHSHKNSMIADLSTWFQKAMALETIVHVQKPMGYLEFGKSNQSTTPDSSIFVDFTNKPIHVFKETLLQLWLKGVNIKWELLYPDGTFSKVSLPTYGFEHGETFWLTKTNEKRIIHPKINKQHLNDLLNQVLEGTLSQEELRDILSREIQDLATNAITATRHQDELDQNQDNNIFILQPSDNKQILSPQDSIIRDHIITGKPMLPGAYMIEFAMETIQKTLNQPVNLYNVIFKNPAIIETEVEVEIEIHFQDKKFILKTETQDLCEGEYEIA